MVTTIMRSQSCRARGGHRNPAKRTRSVEEGRMAASSSSSLEKSSQEGGSGGCGGRGGISEYEKRRLARIRENRARLEALGLPSLASSLGLEADPSKRKNSVEEEEEGGERRNKGKNKKKKKGKEEEDDDDEYQPSDEGDNDDEEEEEDGNEGEERSEEEEQHKCSSSSSQRKEKKKNTPKAGKFRKNLCLGGNLGESYESVDDDATLQQAIALSLGGFVNNSYTSGMNISDSNLLTRKDRANRSGAAQKRKDKSKSRVQLTEDEVVAYFFSFDEVGKGYLTVRDLQKMASAHDFTWTESEIYNMIHSFDSDGDGKLSLGDFRTIISRCNMLQELGDP